ncbi:uncharacterized protein LOC134534726 isoform X2 [Bacillus rossius redtenbacheri]|uniref:uncharacterized protein LOC134534726 isoform X2 n=1 Tax=Bacillus rossius redtenbacheri TaxID=93214 RepID=UPI002FDCAA82
MSWKLCALILQLYWTSTHSDDKPKLYKDEEEYFLRFSSHSKREEYLQCILKKGTNVIFYGNYTNYGHILRTHSECFNQSELDSVWDLKRVFRDYETLQYYMDGEYHDCNNGTEATLQTSLTGMDTDFHVNVHCMDAFRDRVVNFQVVVAAAVKSYPWVMGFEVALLTVLLALGVPANSS